MEGGAQGGYRGQSGSGAAAAATTSYPPLSHPRCKGKLYLACRPALVLRVLQNGAGQGRAGVAGAVPDAGTQHWRAAFIDPAGAGPWQGMPLSQDLACTAAVNPISLLGLIHPPSDPVIILYRDVKECTFSFSSETSQSTPTPQIQYLCFGHSCTSRGGGGGSDWGLHFLFKGVLVDRDWQKPCTQMVILLSERKSEAFASSV